MGPEPFTLHHDREHDVLISTLRGVWDDATMRHWEERYRRALQRVGPGFRTVSDLTDYPLQAPELQDRTQALMELTISGGLRLGVMVVTETILQIQMKRLTGGVGGDRELVRFTSSCADAESLLGLPPGSIRRHAGLTTS